MVQELRPFWKLTAATLVFAVSLAAYLETLAPTVTGEDSGELISAAYSLGIAHPPGYPTWCLLGKAFTIIVPFGDVAYRVNFMSAVFAALTGSFTFLLILDLSGSLVGAIAGSLCLAFSWTLWSQSAIAEVYSLNAFFLVACTWLLLRWERGRSKNLLYAFALLYGLSVTNHHTMVALGPVFALFLFVVEPRMLLRGRQLLAMTGLFLLGASLYLYLPIRAAAHPPINWGNPSDVPGLLFHVLRGQYPKGSSNPRSLAIFLGQLGVFLNNFLYEFTPWMLWPALYGCYLHWRKNKMTWLLLLGVFLMCSVGFVLVINFKLEQEHILANSVFFIPAYVVAAIWLGVGLAFLQEAARKSLPARVGAVVTAGLLLTPLIPWTANHFPCDMSSYYYAYDYGSNLLRTLEPDATFIPSSDHATFPVLYLQIVEGRRPDVVVGDKYGYIERGLYQGMPGEFPRIATQRQRRAIERWVIMHARGPVYFSIPRNMSDLPQLSMVPVGLLYRVVRRDEEYAPSEDYWEAYTWRGLDGPFVYMDYTAEAVSADYHVARAIYELRRGAHEEGRKELELAAAHAQGMKETYNNLGSVAAGYGLPREAVRYYEKALQIAADYVSPHMNLGLLYRDAGQYEKSAEQFALATSLAPDDPHPYRELGFLYLNHFKDRDKALSMWERSLALDPTQEDLAALTKAVRAGSAEPGTAEKAQ